MKVGRGKLSISNSNGPRLESQSHGLKGLLFFAFSISLHVLRQLSSQTFGHWHNYHGGCAKLFIASCLAEVLALVDGSSKNEKIQMVDQHLKAYLKAWAKTSKSNKMPHSGGPCS